MRCGRHIVNSFERHRGHTCGENSKKFKVTGNLLFNLNILKRGFASRVRNCKLESMAYLRRSGLSIQSYGLTAPRRARNPSQKCNNVCERSSTRGKKG